MPIPPYSIRSLGSVKTRSTTSRLKTLTRPTYLATMDPSFPEAGRMICAMALECYI